MRTKRVAAFAALVLAALVLAGPAAAVGAPQLEVDSSHNPATVAVGTYAKYTVAVSNPGDTVTSGPITVTFEAPAGMHVASASSQRLLGLISVWSCSTAPDALSATCTSDPTFASANPGQEACQGFGGTCHVLFIAGTDSGLAPGTTLSPTVEACGGGAASCAEVSDPTDTGPLEFRITGFDGTTLKQNGDPATQAGSHPYTAAAEFHFSTALGPAGTENSIQDLKDATVRVPPGLLANPQGYPRCSGDQLGAGNFASCPPESQVGVITLWLNGNFNGGVPTTGFTGLYNMAPPHGSPAVFGMNIGGVPVHVYARLRTGEDYGATLITKNAAETLPFAGITFTVWGVPAAASHDSQRFCAGMQNPGCATSLSSDPKPFASLPTSCVGPVETFLEITGWQGGQDSASFLSHDNTLPAPNPIGNDGCNRVPFDPTLQARPSTNVADAPSGLDVDLHVPQNDLPAGNTTAHLKDTTVTLPEGLVVNPSGANGLDGCSLAEFGYTSTDPDGTIRTTPDAAACPGASKVATVEVDTPLLDHPVKGAAYIADPHANPFDSLLALYIAIDDPQTGIVAKLAGEITPDPNTGQLSTTFRQSPQLPFQHFKLNFFDGVGAPLRTPATCGDYATKATLTPWTAPDGGEALALDNWTIDAGPGGGCAQSPAEQPHAPSFDAGAVSPIAGAHSPFVVHLRREDGSQNFAAVTVRPPLGLSAKLAGTPACSDGDLAAAAAKSGNAEKASPSCPAASEIGKVVAGAGAGPAPYYAHGAVYLAGPYKGAPISLATVIPATAGPFDLGTVVTRIAAHINPATAEITADSDPIPHILQGIPLDVKSVDVYLDKPDFSLNPTNCNPMAVNGLLTSTLGQVANLSARFQLGECTNLGFAPKMAIRLKGGTARGKYPQLSAYVLPREGDANIRSVSVSFPRSEFLANEHIRTICTRPQFAADACPGGSVYGTSTVYTPLLDYPLTGNVHLRSSDNLLPDVVPDLRGPARQPIKVEAAGRTDSVRGGIRNTFDFFPDAPFSKAVLKMQGGNKGLLVNSRNICARKYRAIVKFTGHDGSTITRRPQVKSVNCKNKKRKKGKRRAHRRSKRAALSAGP